MEETESNEKLASENRVCTLKTEIKPISNNINDGTQISLLNKENENEITGTEKNLNEVEKKASTTKIALLKEILYNSFAQASIRFILSPYLDVKIFLLIFLLGSSGLASYLVIQSIMEYFTYGVITTSRTIYETPTLFPMVTICNVNWLQTEYAYNLIQQGVIDHVTPLGTFNYKNFSNEQKKMLGHDLNDILVDCKYNGHQCDSSDFIWSFDEEEYGNCFIFNSGVDSNGKRIDLKKSYLAGPNFGLFLTFYVNIYEKLSNTVLGAVIRIGNSSYSTYYSNNGIFVSPGERTFISIEREFKSMLPKPYSNCEIDIHSSKFRPDSDLFNRIAQSEYVYSQQFCLSQCLQQEFIKKHNCTLHFVLSIFNASECHVDLNFSSADFFDSNFVWPKICLPLCPLECNQTAYKTTVSFNQLNGNSYVSYIKNNKRLASDFIGRSLDSIQAEISFSSVKIFYESLSYTLTNESKKMDWVSLLGSIGGNLGLFLGVSLFSLWEIIEVVVEIFYHV